MVWKYPASGGRCQLCHQNCTLGWVTGTFTMLAGVLAMLAMLAMLALLAMLAVLADPCCSVLQLFRSRTLRVLWVNLSPAN